MAAGGCRERRRCPPCSTRCPYRKGDGTEARDATRYPYIAGHGYACVRLDLRGSGDSEGLIEDEYTAQEQDDVEAVIAWLAAQPWCDGAVGMIGVSWGGFSALQAAARNPPALRGIVAIHASDDRYADDVHYIGGCVLASDMLHWSACMSAYTAQPPDPAVVGEGWREAWRERLESMEPWVATWLAHQRRDEYWRQGSACEHYAEIALPGVRGRRLGRRLPRLGAAAGRERARPGARADRAVGPHLARARRARAGDRLPAGGRALLRLRAQGRRERLPGRAAAGQLDAGADRAGDELRGAAGALGRRSGVAVAERRDARAGARRRAARAACAGSSSPGCEGGVWCGDGGPADLPGDQRAGGRRIAVLGLRAARASGSSCSARGRRCSSSSADRPIALVAVRLCDVAPDGSSSLIARGVLNLTHREGHDRVVPLVPGEPVTVRVPMQSTAYAVPAGHALRLAVSPTYWPWVWPSPEPVTLTVDAAGRSSCRCARGRPTAPAARVRPAGVRARAGGGDARRAGRPGARVHARPRRRRGRGRGSPWIDGRSLLPASATELAERNVVHYRLVEGDPLSAEASCEVDVELARGDWRTRRARCAATMTCDRERFLVTTELDAYEGGDAPLRAPLDARDRAGRRMSAPDAPLVVVRGSRDRAARARRAIFRRAWQYAGRRDELTAPGSFAAAHVGGLPVVLTRDRDDVLRAFANVCRHRGALVATGAAERGTLQCPYHAWTYGLDGCLRAAPRTEPGRSTAAGSGWCRWRSARGGRSCSSTPTPAPRRSSRRSATCPRSSRAHGLDVDALRFHHRVEYEIRANWKIALENYLECYHCRLNHPGLVAVIDDRRLTMEATRAAREPVQPCAPGLRRRRRARRRASSTCCSRR